MEIKPVILNPGTQSIEVEHSEAQALFNLEQFVKDLGIGRIVKVAHPLDGKDGRYYFHVLHHNGAITVWMPACSIERLISDDYLTNYRLDLNGSSWYWGIAIGIAKDYLENPSWLSEPMVDRRQSYLLQAGYLPDSTTTHCCGAVIEECWVHPLIEGSAHSFCYEYGSNFVSAFDED